MSKWWKFWDKKKQPNLSRIYSAAQYNRLVNDWIAQGTSADAEINTSLPKLRSRSRQLGRDNDYVRSAFRDIQNNVIGQGIDFQAQVRNQRGGRLNDPLNTNIETEWKRWTKKNRCDVAGKLSFSDIERIAIRSVVESGEVIVRKITQSFGGSKVPLGLEIIEPDLLDEAKNGMADNGNECRMGVEIDRWGRPVAYYFKDRHPGDYQFNYQSRPRNVQHIRVPASEVIHLFVMERPGQTRGVPWLASSMIRLRHLHGYEEAEVIAARAGASLMGFIESDQGELIGDGVDGADRVTEFEPGTFKYLAPGEKVTVPSLDRPSGQFDPFFRAMLRGLAAGIGCSFESVSKDFSQSNYSSSRLALLQDRDNWRALQKWMIQNFHQPIIEAWLDLAFLAGALDLPRYEIAPELYHESIRWMPRGWAWVDPEKEVAAYKEAIKGGLSTMSEVVAQSGSDIEELMTQRRREMDLAESLNLTFDTDPAVEQPSRPQPTPAS